MINPKVQKYIDEHAIGSEYLFMDWEPFLDLLYAEGGRVSAILWWDYCEESQQPESVGSGGYRDPENDAYVYAETQFYQDELETKTLDEIKRYIGQQRESGFRYGDSYRSHELIPSFYLTTEENGSLRKGIYNGCTVREQMVGGCGEKGPGLAVRGSFDNGGVGEDQVREDRPQQPV